MIVCGISISIDARLTDLQLLLFFMICLTFLYNPLSCSVFISKIKN